MSKTGILDYSYTINIYVMNLKLRPSNFLGYNNIAAILGGVYLVQAKFMSIKI